MPLGLTFNESLVLLGATALLTGVLAPIIVGITNRNRLNEQKRYEEELKRETAFFDAQAAFLKEFSTAVWDFLEQALAVSYAGWLDPNRFEERWEAYERESFALLGHIGSQITLARTLFSSETADRLDDFYGKWLEGDFERGLSNRARDPATTPDQWGAWHAPMHRDGQERAAALIRTVAEEAGLTYEQQQQRLRARAEVKWYDFLRSPKRATGSQ